MRVVDAIATWFGRVGVDHYFGYAGGAIWPFLDALMDHPKMDGIQAKIESNAVHMARRLLPQRRTGSPRSS